jgi:hypothetical protein
MLDLPPPVLMTNLLPLNLRFLSVVVVLFVFHSLQILKLQTSIPSTKSLFIGVSSINKSAEDIFVFDETKIGGGGG